VIALGDRIRDGWLPAAVLGLLLAGVASVLLHDPREGAPTGARPAARPADRPQTDGADRSRS